MSDEELKQWAIDYIAGKIFTDSNVSAKEIPVVFMPFASFFASFDNSLMDKDTLLDIGNKIKSGEYALIYEYIDKAISGLNGKPVFASCKFLSKDEMCRVKIIIDKIRQI